MPGCILLLIVGIALILWTWQLYYQRSDRLLKNWATESGIEILSSKRSMGLWAGPFRYRVRGQEIYKIVVKDTTTNSERVGWIRIGSVWPSIKVPAAQFEVVWEGRE